MDSENVISNAVVRYGGLYSAGCYNYYGNCDTYYGAIRFTKASPTITDTTVTTNKYGLYADGGSPTVTNSRIYGNSDYGFYNASQTITVNAEHNWWGDDTGPYDPSDDRGSGGLYNPYGRGDKVSDHVDYDPWTGGVRVTAWKTYLPLLRNR